jgi:hypothetical protein
MPPTAGECPNPTEPQSALDRAIKQRDADARAAESEKQFAKAVRELKGERTPEDIDADVIANKELRRDLDTQLQKLKSLPSSRHRALAITHLEDVILRLGLDLKRLNDSRPTPATPTKTLRELAVEAYARYGAVTDFKNFQGNPMPKFDELPDTIKRAWEAAVSADNGRPYPSSYDPSNAKVEPTAEGLKL